MKKFLKIGILFCVGATGAAAQDRDKLADDPTKIITKLGVRYTDYASVSGSIAFGPVTKVNVSVSESGEWSLGGSYLFNFGIVNIAASQKDLTNGTSQTQYSIGSFVPLSALGTDTGQWQVFPTLGFNYTEGQSIELDVSQGDLETAGVSSKGGYIGLMALRPLSDAWTFKTMIIASKGSNDYSGISIGAGVTYGITSKDSASLFGYHVDNSFGQRDVVGIGYKREF